MLKECTPSEDGTHVVIPSKTYDSTRLALSKMVSFLDQSATAQCDAIQAMEDAEQHVLQVNADLYNNYKLMANGMITEAITHELDSVSKTSIPQDADLHFKTLKNLYWIMMEFWYTTTTSCLFAIVIGLCLKSYLMLLICIIFRSHFYSQR